MPPRPASAMISYCGSARWSASTEGGCQPRALPECGWIFSAQANIAPGFSLPILMVGCGSVASSDILRRAARAVRRCQGTVPQSARAGSFCFRPWQCGVDRMWRLRRATPRAGRCRWARPGIRRRCRFSSAMLRTFSSRWPGKPVPVGMRWPTRGPVRPSGSGLHLPASSARVPRSRFGFVAV